MLQNFNFDYDSENDSLFVYNPKSKSKASVEMDDFIIDFSSRKEISGIELLNATEFLKSLEFEDQRINIKELLKNIEECKIEIIVKENFFVIKFILISKSKERIATPLVIPTINEPSPALAAVA
ncbi:MAG: DUF2283 domain-containing protein [Candidatus Woesearchaeota archaeon]